MNSTNPRIVRITVGRLYNLGSYEHVRYELTIEIPEKASAAKTLEGVERLLSALNPREPGGVPSETDISGDELRVTSMKERLLKGEDEFDRHYGHSFVGTREEYIARCEGSLQESMAKRKAWKERSQKARLLLDDLGGAAEWKDAKLNWDGDDYFD